MSDTEAIDLETAGLLDADTIPNANQSHACFSCGESMSGVFCYACGNKNDNYRRSIWSLGAELFSSLTAFEGRIWRSLRSLIFKPGQMAREFSDGARQKWTSPIRLYLAMSLLLFGYIALSQTQLLAFGTKLDVNSTNETGVHKAEYSPQVFFLERKSTIRETVTDEAISAFEKNIENIISDDDDKTKEDLENELERMRENLEKVEDQIDNAKNKYAKAGISKAKPPMLAQIKRLETQIKNHDVETKNAKSSTDGLKRNSPDEHTTDTELKDGNNINVTSFGNSFTLDSEGLRKAFSIALRQPERVNAPISKYLPRIMFVMMPFSMLMGAIFIRGREKAMLFDHLVHAAYIHAFSFLLLFVFILLVQLTSIKSLLGFYTLILLIYLPISAKRMFGRSWLKTFLTSYGVGLIYTLIMMIILMFLILYGFADIAADVSAQSQS